MANNIFSDSSKIFDKNIILKYIKKCVDTDHLELECVFNQSIITKATFLKVIDNLKEISSDFTESESLDIKCWDKDKRKLTDTRITIQGIQEIMKYCKTESLKDIENIEYLKKEFYKDTTDTKSEKFQLTNNDYNYRLNVKTEIILQKENPDVLKVLNNYEKKPKHFRFKKRYSFITYDKLFRFDITAVKSSSNEKDYKYQRTFKGSDILRNRENYEIEIEYIGSSSIDGSKIVNKFHKDLLDGKVLPSIYSFSKRKDVSYIDEKQEPFYEPDADFYTTPTSYYIDPFEKLIGKRCFVKTDFWSKNSIISSIYEKIKDDSVFKVEAITGIIKAYREFYSTENYYGDDLNGKYVLIAYHLNNEIWIPVSEIYSNDFDIDAIILASTEQSGGAKLSTWDESKNYDKLYDKLYELFNEHIYYMLTVIHNTNYLLTENDKMNILNGYKTIASQKIRNIKDLELQLPQPCTLTLNDINPKNQNTMLMNYAVTEKADGERYILYIHKNRGYLINNKKNIIDTGVEFIDLNKEYVFDGEYITKNINNEDIKLFMIFDIYYIKTGSEITKVHKYPFIYDKINANSFGVQQQRHELIQQFKKENLLSADFNTTNIRIDIKNYDFGNYKSKSPKDSDKYLSECTTLLKKCQKILIKSDKKSYEYHIDGLIFLPLFNSVKSKNNIDNPDYIKGTWYQNYKWKPPEENTIDFKLRFVKEKTKRGLKQKIIPFIYKDEEGNEILQKYKVAQLFVGYDYKQDDTIKYCMRILDNSESLFKGNEILFNPDNKKILHTFNIPLNSNGKIICERDNREIKDNDIIEMRYNPNATNNMFWEPLRIRDDKIKPQFFTIANNVWNTIINPVTETFIRNNIKLDDFDKLYNEDIENKYYIGENNDYTDTLRKLHNYIKSKLIISICSSFDEEIQILDLSIGRGGDLNKYLDKFSNAKFILGLDLFPVDEACKRYYEHNRRGKSKAVFAQGDTSQNFMNADCYEDVNISVNDKKHSETMLGILYNKHTSIPKEYKKIHKEFNNLALQKFEVINSQFTFHYYFETEDKFKNTINNIIKNITPGGYFIGMCYDGEKIFNLLKNKSKFEYIHEDGRLIYSIEKKYETTSFDESTSPINLDNVFGQQIDVYMDSIGQTIPEYLVNFKFFKNYMEQNGFQLTCGFNKLKIKRGVSSGTNIFYEDLLTDGYGDFEKIINQLSSIKTYDKDLQKQGKYEKSMEILNKSNEKLRLLSSLNKYFIFQKI